MTDFKDCLTRTHDIILREAFPREPEFRSREAFLDSRTMANLIVAPRNLYTEQDHKIVYSGITGASWLECSTDVLGLNVCLTYEDGRICLVKGNYGSLSVVVLPPMLE
jgi:hypothetical protein